MVGDVYMREVYVMSCIYTDRLCCMSRDGKQINVMNSLLVFYLLLTYGCVCVCVCVCVCADKLVHKSAESATFVDATGYTHTHTQSYAHQLTPCRVTCAFIKAFVCVCARRLQGDYSHL